MKIYKYFDFTRKVVLANFKKLSHPYKIFLVVTKSCNSRCINCQIWKETSKDELTLVDYRRLAQNLGKHLSWLNISGGEPTDREDLIEIIKIFIEYCPNLLIINLTSNGLEPQRLIDLAEYLNLSSIPIVGINVSIDGPEEVHVKLRGGVDSYKRAIKSLAAIRLFKRFHTHASMTLFESNAHLVDLTYQEIKKYIKTFSKDELHLNYSFHSEHYYQNTNVRSTIGQISPKISHKPLPVLLLNPISIIKNIYSNNLLKYNENKVTPIPCSSMTSGVYISELGELYPCTIWNEKIGSLKDNNYDLKSLLETKHSIELKNKIALNECPNCWSPCEAFPSILDNLKDAIR